MSPIGIDRTATAISSMFETKTDSKAEEKEKDITSIPDEPEQFNYWAADRINNTVVIGEPLNAQAASIRVATGKSLMCKNQAAAQHIIFLNGYVNAVGPERHHGGYLHYHPTRNHTGYDSVHIWYYE